MKLDELLEKIKNEGGRLTKTRIAVLEVFLSLNKPLSPFEMIEALKEKKIEVNKTTVYREITFLLKNNIIRKVRLLEGKAVLYELSHEHCHHLVCLKCHHIETLQVDNQLCQQEEIIYHQANFKVLEHSLEFYGICNKCQ